jgi:2-alkyl-3-oxoalkanoate reductase
MNIFVTGATGFIGRYLVQELLDHNYEVTILSRKKSKTIPNTTQIIGDITQPETFSKHFSEIDAVFHNAAFAMDHGKKKDFFNINVQGTRNVAQACIQNNVSHLIYTSSAGVYGYPKQGTVITEDTVKKPLNLYQKTKWLGEVALKEYDSLKISAIRPPLVFGPEAPAIQIAFDKLKKHKFPYIGSGEQLLPIVHPVDVVRCMRAILEKDTKGDVFNVLSFQVSIKEFMETIAKKTGISPPQKHVPFFLAYTAATFSELFSKDPDLTRFRVKSLGCTRIISAEKAKRVLGFTPMFDFEHTATDIAQWYHQKFS